MELKVDKERWGFIYGWKIKKRKKAADSRAALWETTSAGKEGENKKKKTVRGKGKKKILQFHSGPRDTVGSRQHKAQGPRRSERRATSETAPIWRWDAY